MLGYVAPLWIVGVVCLIAAVAGKAVKVSGSELPALTSPVARIAMAAIGVLALALGLVLFLPGTSAQSSQGSPATSSGAPPAGTPPAAPRTPSADPPTATSPTPSPTAPAAVRVRWHGTLILGGYGGTGGGWFLDSVPPAPSVTGDIFFGGTNQITGSAIVAWDGPGPPTQQQCADLLSTRLGQHGLDVRVGTMGCFATDGQRVGYLRVDRTPDPDELTPSMTVEATVWELR